MCVPPTLPTLLTSVGDSRFQSIGVVSLDNGIDQGTYVESHKAIYPYLGCVAFPCSTVLT